MGGDGLFQHQLNGWNGMISGCPDGVVFSWIYEDARSQRLWMELAWENLAVISSMMVDLNFRDHVHMVRVEPSYGRVRLNGDLR